MKGRLILDSVSDESVGALKEFRMRAISLVEEVRRSSPGAAELLKDCPSEAEAYRHNDPTWIFDYREAVIEWLTSGLLI